MKKTIILFVLLINSFPAFAQTTLLRGKATLQNSKGRPVQGVQISAFGANPTISNHFGQFELKFFALCGWLFDKTVQHPLYLIDLCNIMGFLLF